MNEDSFVAFRRMSRTVGLALVLGIVGIVIFSLQAGAPVSIGAVLSIAMLVAGAAFASGGVIGFIFGIPKSLQEVSIPPTAGANAEADRSTADGLARVRYVGNTSLEQISDWLTKIIVGVGLTQLTNLPTALAALGDGLGGALGNFAGSKVVAPLEVVFFAIGGFILGYLWTRLYLVSLLVESDEEAREAAEHDRELRAIEVATGLQAASPTAQPAGARAGEPAERKVLWVDDRPSNNRREIDQLEMQGIRVVTSTSTESALAELGKNAGKYKLVITDMVRGLDRRAGYTLLKGIRDNHPELPVIIYAGSSSADHDAEAKKNGALGSTGSPIQLFELVSQALQNQQPAP